MSKKSGGKASPGSRQATDAVKKATEKTKNGAVLRDVSIIFIAGLILSLLLEKAAWYCDWDTIDSVLRMNAAGYNPISVPPVRYHLLIEPLVYGITAVLSPLLGPDHMVGFVVLTAVFSAGLLALTYYAARTMTGDRTAAIVATLVLAISYNFLYLTLSVTQNQVNQFFNLLAVLLGLAVMGRIDVRVDRRILAVSLGITMGLAAGTNLRSLYLLAMLPLIVLLGADRKAALRDTIIGGACAVISIGALALISAWLGLSSGPSGFFSVVYYQDSKYWFFAGQGDLLAQASSAGIGFLRNFTGDGPALALGAISPYLPVVAFTGTLCLFVYLLRDSLKDAAVITIGVLLIINTVNSIFYEPLSLERWDHAALFLGLLAGIAWAGGKAGSRSTDRLIVGGLLIIMAVCLLGTIAGAAQTTQYVSFMYAKLPQSSFSGHPGLIVISAEESSVPAKYMAYLYGQENVVSSKQFRTTEEMIPYLDSVHANRTLYLDQDECLALDGRNGTEDLLSSVVPVDDSGIWYRIDRAR